MTKFQVSGTIVFENDAVTGDFNEDFILAEIDDGGQAMIAEFPYFEPYESLFIRLHSWDTNMKHSAFKSLRGRKIRITIETMDECK